MSDDRPGEPSCPVDSTVLRVYAELFDDDLEAVAAAMTTARVAALA